MVETNEPQNNDSHVSYSFTYPVDPDGFFRRQCPECGLHFKVKLEPDSIGTLLSPVFERIEREYGISLQAPTTGTESSSKVACPYCGALSEPRDMGSNEFYQYIHRWTQREIVYPLLNKMFGDMEDIFNRGSQKSRGGILSLEIKFEHHRSPAPIRPIPGPEPPDMNIVHLLCCDKELKILPGWFGSIFCPYCSKDLILR